MPVSIAFLPDSTAEWGTAAATTTRPVRVFEAFEGTARVALDAVWVTANMVPGGAHRQCALSVDLLQVQLGRAERCFAGKIERSEKFDQKSTARDGRQGEGKDKRHGGRRPLPHRTPRRMR